MSLSTKQYLALSHAAYSNLPTDDNPDTQGLWTIGELLSKNKIKDPSNPAASALSELSNWRLIAFEDADETFQLNSPYALSFAAAAFQSPTGEIVFTFRGSDAPMDYLVTDPSIALFVPQTLNAQFSKAKQFVFDTLNQFGLTSYTDEDTMFDALSQSSNVSFTGHSLGGGIAQYMTYVTADMGSDDVQCGGYRANYMGSRYMVEWLAL